MILGEIKLIYATTLSYLHWKMVISCARTLHIKFLNSWVLFLYIKLFIYLHSELSYESVVKVVPKQNIDNLNKQYITGKH